MMTVNTLPERPKSDSGNRAYSVATYKPGYAPSSIQSLTKDSVTLTEAYDIFAEVVAGGMEGLKQVAVIADSGHTVFKADGPER